MSILRFCLLFSDIVDYIKLFVRIVRHLCTWYNDCLNAAVRRLIPGEQHKGSDIDIMVLTTFTDTEIEKI